MVIAFRLPAPRADPLDRDRRGVASSAAQSLKRVMSSQRDGKRQVPARFIHSVGGQQRAAKPQSKTLERSQILSVEGLQLEDAEPMGKLLIIAIIVPSESVKAKADVSRSHISGEPERTASA
jgi:hypothetical protein